MREQRILWLLVFVIAVLVSEYFYASVRRAQNDHENHLYSGIETFVATKVHSIEQSFKNVSKKSYTREQFNDYLTSFIVPITSSRTSETTKLRSILISRSKVGDEYVCAILTPGAEVGQSVIPCENEVLDATFTSNKYFNRSRNLPRSGIPAMYLTQLISTPFDPLFFNDEYLLLADWAREDSDKMLLRWTQLQVFLWFLSMVFILFAGWYVNYRWKKASYNQRLLDNLFRYCSSGLVVAKATDNPEDGGLIVKSNRMMNELAGRNLKNTLIRDLMPDRYVGDHNKGFDRVVKGAASDVVNNINRELLHMLNKEGKEIPVNIIPGMFEQDGENLFIASVTDITTIVEQIEEIKRLEDEKRSLMEMFMEAQRKLIAATNTNTEIIKRRTDLREVK